MHSVLTEHPTSVEAEIDFLVPGPARAFAYGGDPPRGAQPATTEFEARRVAICDVRSHSPLSIEANGALLGCWPSAVRSFDDHAQLRRHYYPEAAEIICTALGADSAIVFDHNLRHSQTADLGLPRYPVSRPVRHAHADYTGWSAAGRLQRELGADAGMLRYARFMQVNLWRPIRGPLRDAPLAICDGATVSAGSLHATELRYPDRTGEIYYLAHARGQRWYFASDMSVEEAWLFKNFDSSSDAAVRVVPHSAFDDPRGLQKLPRESIEVRAFALFRA